MTNEEIGQLVNDYLVSRRVYDAVVRECRIGSVLPYIDRAPKREADSAIATWMAKEGRNFTGDWREMLKRLQAARDVRYALWGKLEAQGLKLVLDSLQV